jgi:hypothetical protein
MGLVFIGLVLAVIGVSAVLTIRAMARAPLGYQDDQGFHYAKPAAGDDFTPTAPRPATRSRRPLRPQAGHSQHAA